MGDVCMNYKPLKKDRVSPPIPHFEKAIHEKHNREDCDVSIHSKCYDEHEDIPDTRVKRIVPTQLRKIRCEGYLKVLREHNIDVRKILGDELYTMCVMYYDDRCSLSYIAECYSIATQTVANKIYGQRSSALSKMLAYVKRLGK